LALLFHLIFHSQMGLYDIWVQVFQLSHTFGSASTLDLARKEKQNREQQDPIEHAMPMRTTLAEKSNAMFSRSCTV
jgi:hypothetical protein